MAFNPHKGTAGHTIGSQIIGKEKPGQPNEDNSMGQTATGFQHLPDIHTHGAVNGITVSHTPKMPKGESGQEQIGHPETPVEEQMHVFRSAEEAHHHIGQLLGVRLGSGAQPV
jgi:hypothetical protein